MVHQCLREASLILYKRHHPAFPKEAFFCEPCTNCGSFKNRFIASLSCAISTERCAFSTPVLHPIEANATFVSQLSGSGSRPAQTRSSRASVQPGFPPYQAEKASMTLSLGSLIKAFFFCLEGDKSQLDSSPPGEQVWTPVS